MNHDIIARGDLDVSSLSKVGADLADHQQSQAAIAQQGMTRVQTQYATAIRVPEPRRPEACLRQLKASARLLGEQGYYRWSVRSKGGRNSAVEGPSIDLALEAARIWGNCALEHHPIQETHDAWIFYCSFVDLESGATFSRPFRMSKNWNVGAGLDDARAEDVRFQIGASKAARNVILNALPKWLVNEALEECKKGSQERLERFIADNGKTKAIDMIVKGLGEFDVKEEDILAKAEVASLEGLEVRHLAGLRGDLQALSSGQEFPDALFPSMKPRMAERRLAEAALPDLDADQAQGPAAKAPDADAESLQEKLAAKRAAPPPEPVEPPTEAPAPNQPDTHPPEAGRRAAKRPNDEGPDDAELAEFAQAKQEFREAIARMRKEERMREAIAPIVNKYAHLPHLADTLGAMVDEKLGGGEGLF